MRLVWFAGGWTAVAFGAVGIVVPGLPTTVFFIIAAWCFSRSSPRFEQWVLDLPRIGPMVRAHRAGEGMPRRAKGWAIGMMAIFGTFSAFAVDNSAISGTILALVAIGAWYITTRVPTQAPAAARATDATGGSPPA